MKKLTPKAFLPSVKKSISLAFNLDGDPQLGYVFDAATQERARELYEEIRHLMQHARPKRALDTEFRAFMGKAL